MMKKINFFTPLFLIIQFLTPSFSNCLEEVSEKYSISKKLLLSIAYVESKGNELAISKLNKNGTFDIGLMQINSAWLPLLRKKGFKDKDLLDPCVSLDVAGWILAANIDRFGMNWKAVGAFNSTNLGNQQAYVNKVYATYKHLSMLSSEHPSKFSIAQLGN
jgi:soluble lytic murein transglycosylase-like protein